MRRFAWALAAVWLPSCCLAASSAVDPALAAVSRRYSTAVTPLPDLGFGDLGDVRSGVMPRGARRMLGADLPAAPGEPVAVKIANIPGISHVLAHEGQVSRRLRDAGGADLFVRAVYDPAVDALVMEKLAGYKPLDEWARRYRGGLNERAIARVEAQLRRGLAVLEAAGRVPSDLRPPNVLVGPGARVKIVDLGSSADAGAYPPSPYEDGRLFRGGNHWYAPARQMRDEPAAFEDDRHAVDALLKQLRPQK